MAHRLPGIAPAAAARPAPTLPQRPACRVKPARIGFRSTWLCAEWRQLEGHLLIPLLMKEGMDLPPALTLVTQGVMALLFGFLGLMVAVPLLATVIVPIKLLYVQGVLGDAVYEDEADEAIELAGT